MLARGDSRHLKNQMSHTLQASTRATAVQLRQLRAIGDWRFHSINSIKEACTRLSENADKKEVVQTVIVFDTMQSVVLRDEYGRILPGSGSHDKPKRVVENMCFQLLTKEAAAPWVLVRTVPNFTQQQMIGSVEEEVKGYEARRPREAQKFTTIA